MSLTRVRTGAGVLGEVHATTTAVNTTVETTVLTIPLPAGRLQTGDVVRIKAFGTRISNAASAVNYTVKIVLGTTALFNSGALAAGPNVNPSLWVIDADIKIVGTNQQRCYGTHQISNETNITSGALKTGSCLVFRGPTAGPATEDTSTAKNLTITVTMGTADANASFTCDDASATLHREAA